MAGEKIAEGYIELRARMSKFESQLKSAEVMTGKSVSKMQAKFKALAPTFRKVGIGMAVAGGAITAALGLTIKSAISFNKEMANIATLIPGATKRVIELKGAIRTMAVDVGKSTADLAQGAYQVISAFGDTADTVAILEMSAKAATAGVAGTTEAINLLSAVTKGYGDTSKEAVKKASDLAFQTVTLGQTTFPELAASIGLVIPLTAELGVSQEELFAVMATGTGVTGKAAQVATQLRGIMQALMSPTADMTILFKDMGFRSGKAMLAEKGLAGSLEIIKSVAEESNTPLQKYIGSIEGQTLALALTGTQADTYITKLAAMRDSVGLTDIAFREQTEGINATGFAFEQAKIRVGVLGQEIGDRLLPMITPLIEKVSDLVKKMSDWAKAHPGISTAIVKFMAVLGPLLIGLGGLLIVLPGLVALAPMVGAAFHIMLGPIGLITIAIAAAVAAFLYFYKTSDKFRNFVNKIGAYMKALVQNIWQYAVWLKDNWGKIWATMLMGIVTIVKNAFDDLIIIFKWIGSFISDWGKWLGANFFNVWKNMFSAVSTGLENFGTNIVAQLGWLGKKMNPKNWFKKVERPDWTPIFEGFEAIWTEMPQIVELSLKKLTTGIKNFMEPLPKLVKPVLKAVEEVAEGTGKAINELGKDVKKTMTEWEKAVKVGGRKIVGTTTKFIGVVSDEWKKVVPVIEGVATDTEERWNDMAHELYKQAQWFFRVLKDEWKKIVPIIEKVATDLEKRWDDMNHELYKESLWFFGVLKDEWGKIKPVVEEITTDIVEKWDDMNYDLYKKSSWFFGILKDEWKKVVPVVERVITDLKKRWDDMNYELYKESLWFFGVLKDEWSKINPIVEKVVTEEKEKWDDMNQELYKESLWFFGVLKDEWKKVVPVVEKSVDTIVNKFGDGAAIIVDEWERLGTEIVVIIDSTAEKVIKTWANVWESIGRAAFASIVDIIRGVETMEEAFLEFAKKVQTIVVDALLDLAVAAAKAGNIMGATLFALGALIVSIADKIADWITGADVAKKAMGDMLEYVARRTNNLSEAFKDMGMSLTGSINDAERAIRNLMQTQEELAMNTREKLIKELDNYYDYRVLREMDLTALLALSAETREKLEKGTLESIAETAEEVAEREKDAKVGTLQAIEDAYARESVLIEKKLKMLEIEIKLLMAAALAEQGKLKEAEKLTNEANYALAHLLYTQEELNEKVLESRDAIRGNIPFWKEFGREGRKAADNARIGIELWGDEINKIPRKIEFEVIGRLDMPTIPRINPRYFDIIGEYRAPNIPSYQVGTPFIPRTMPVIVHREEAILNPIQAREWRAGGAGGGTQITYERGAIRMTVMGGINKQVDLEEAMDYLARKQAREMEKV